MEKNQIFYVLKFLQLFVSQRLLVLLKCPRKWMQSTKMNFSSSSFKVLSADGVSEVGKISKQWTGLLKETFTDADNFGITCKLKRPLPSEFHCIKDVYNVFFFSSHGPGCESEGNNVGCCIFNREYYNIIFHWIYEGHCCLRLILELFQSQLLFLLVFPFLKSA